MRGLPIESITQVQLLHDNHPLVQDFLGWVYKQRDARLEATYLERQHERDRLSDLLQRPYAELATWPDLVRAYDEVIAHRAPTSPERCLDCQHCSPDKYYPGSYVCWLPYAAQGRPRRLTTLTGCGAYTPSVFRHDPGYPQLVDEYVPLLRMAFPHVRFYPLEINRTVPYGYAQKTDPEVAQLVSLDTRLLYHADYASKAIYMLFVLDIEPAGNPSQKGTPDAR